MFLLGATFTFPWLPTIHNVLGLNDTTVMKYSYVLNHHGWLEMSIEPESNFAFTSTLVPPKEFWEVITSL